ncbi:haloacid dehalogenase [Sediminicola sp. YIK13]|uniref:cation-translocating P-type ATPase n=1 Tax=Sediminicola sp. YIK13 TaxID=1453352 RepID=UPI0007216456|nr:cation-translocating P-type ATPase [Sediminicola sp. YIK13]ALM07572.1 haloacid dehalogenase [Sediminicola sp. YIK13]
MSIDNFEITGLTDEQVLQSRASYGQNKLVFEKENRFLDALRSLAKEPMVILLLVASVIYFVSGDYGDGIFLAIAIIMVASISLYQDSRSRHALQKLKDFTQPHSKVYRNGEIIEIKSEELVVGDSLIVDEGSTIPADGTIIHSNDFSVNESILTGESLAVYKDVTNDDSSIYLGTTVASGLAIATITAIGNNTALGKIGKSLEDIESEKTPLELQIGNFVKKMVFWGAMVFFVVWGINYAQSLDLLDSLLKALTLAMSILPEEIPVAFTTFMALGAWRLMKLGVVVKQMKTVETLGSATVICTDKTGTITQNKMSLARVYVLGAEKITNPEDELSTEEKELIRLAMWASEPIPFDPMELALHESYAQNFPLDERPNYKMVHEYPLGGKPPMMTHLFENSSGNRIIAAKGAPEAFLDISGLTEVQKDVISKSIIELARNGYRILGVGETKFDGDNYPKKQQQFTFSFKGLVAFYDPPKENIASVFDQFNEAGITVKIVTGDNAETTEAIAKQVNFKGYEKSISGDDLMKLKDDELKECVKETQIFTRMFPDAKMRIINALKANNEVVVMTGDGVNDGPALKAAHIGVAMGKKGTEIAKQAASLILVDDDLAKMVDAIAMGRKIYTNLKKAIQYVISIHIPIILTVFIPLALGWLYPNIFTPIHVILLELIMGPTCSIIYENEPMEKNTMIQKPRPFSKTFFSWRELMTSVIQGLAITAGTLTVYQLAVSNHLNENTTRAMVFTTLIAANIVLTLVNRSFYFSALTTLKYKNNLVGLIIGITITLTGVLLYIDPFTAFFQFESLTGDQLWTSIGIGFISVIWYEVVKGIKRSR